MTELSDIDEYFGGTVLAREEVEEDIAIGLDLGTTNCCVGIWRKNNLEIIPDAFGNRTMPSIVSFTKHHRYIGIEAKNQTELNPLNTFYEIKRLIGRKITDETVTQDKQYLSYVIDADNNDNIYVRSDYNKNIFTPEEISSMLIGEIKYNAEKYLGREITKIVITVPAHFNDGQRQATKDAATIAGMDCIRIINEPTAAALAYGFNYRNSDMKVLVYDLGGGTLDVSLLSIYEGVFQVLGSCGNTHLGGIDFDTSLINYAQSKFKAKYGYINLTDLSPVSFQKLRKACENAKKLLSTAMQTTIAVNDFYDGKNLIIKITRKDFENICKDLFILCLKPVDDILRSTDICKTEIDEIVLVGGATRIPKIRENLTLFFNKEPAASINPDEVVAAGAAIHAHMITHETDPFSENIILLDVTPLSLGVETIGELMSVIIPRNSSIPTKRVKKYSCDSDFETSVKIKVYEGERKMTKDNFLVGEFELTGLEPGPRGFAQIDICFSIDINGIINVTAEDKRNTNNKNTITINSNKGRLHPDKIKQLVIEAANHNDADKHERNKRELSYRIEEYCTNIKYNTLDESNKLTETDKQTIITEISSITAWLLETHYSNRTEDDFKSVIKNIKNKYNTLILKTSKSYSIKEANVSDKNVTLTSVYNNEDENDEDILELTERTDENTEQIKVAKDTLVNLCYTVSEIISSTNITIPASDLKDLTDYVNDILLWVHVKERITLDEYNEKIQQVNKVCDDITTDDNIFDNKPVPPKDKLEQLCYTLLSSIVSNTISIDEHNMVALKAKIDGTIAWIDGNEASDEEYEMKITEINELCNNLYNSLMSIGVNDKISVL